MLNYIEEQKNRWYAWFAVRAHGPHMRAWLALFAFIESIFFPVPTAAFLIPILMIDARRWVSYAAYTSFFSVLGGIAGYLIAAFFFDTIGIRIIDFYGLSAQMEHVQALFNANAFWVVLTGAFTPIPYKVFVLTAGFLKINFLAFLFASIVGRSMQFFLIGYVMRLFGPTVTRVFLKYFNVVVLIIIGALIAYFFLK